MPARGSRAGSDASDPLAPLYVIDRLEVGPVRLEPRRVSALYRVKRGGRTDEAELAYRYEEDVFDPEEPASRNLGSMIVAQVALNYGLFCGEIVLRGEYDESDHRFLAAMARNTAREIYVKKFLEPNPFLRGEASRLPAVKRESYLRAAPVFEPPPGAEPGKGGRAPWAGNRSRHAVLSSGGKDSLLSFGLLDEMGCEPHPIFVNESGRHWFTALNAFRHLRQTCDRTARVWTSSDRVFNWMARHLPFIRPDFDRVRSDEYPIRLWTVAVFLFGALPLLRRRGIGRLVIGDEFDTTRRVSHAGIIHYDGLFDQSRFFDNALTRYFRRKGWRVSQFSMIRPLSEMAIERTLAKRYPDLLRHQVSCHAAHKKGERVLPCGRCEKCRRIVAMLVACDVDPALAGYTPQQTARCLEELVEKGVHQEAEGAQHLSWTLQQKGRVSPAAPARPRPEVSQLRFDPERSLVEDIPTDLRRPLYRILLEHTEGAVRRRGKVWVPFDPLTDKDLARPYPFESPGREREAQAESPRARSHVLAELTWPEARARFRETDIALLPVGAIEQHGPHLPLDTDAWDADHLALEVAARCADPKPLVLPLIPYGVSYHHEDFSGTLSVSPETLARLVHDVGMGVARHGVTKLVIINGHGGNVPTLQFAAQTINRDAHIFTCVDSGDTSDTDVANVVETAEDVHAGEIETSTALATRPELVRMDKAKRFVPRFPSEYMSFSSRRSVEWYARTAKISSSGVLGDPTRATREKGERIWELMIRHLVAFVETLKGASLNELLDRRY